jgi:hypothetical protein
MASMRTSTRTHVIKMSKPEEKKTNIVPMAHQMISPQLMAFVKKIV